MLLLVPATGTAQSAAVSAAPPEPGSELTISLLTMGQGDLFWEKFGHNALWISDASTGQDIVYNYGTFDFNQENFMLRLIRGTMLYWLRAAPLDQTIYEYEYFNRAMWAQQLDLTPAQKLEIRDFLEWNARPENREYVYDYYRDNCSTRLRDLIDAAIGGQLRARTDTILTSATYRSHTQRLLADLGWPHPGMELALAGEADQPLTRWEELFLPMQLQAELRQTTVTRPDGTETPLVAAEREILPLRRSPPRSEPPSWFGWYLGVGLVIGASIAGLGSMFIRRRSGRLPLAAMTAIWTLLTGFGGVLLLGLWGITDHGIAYANENLLQFNPLALPLVLLAPAMIYRVRWAERFAPTLAITVGALSLLGFLIQVLPPFDQANATIIGLALPANLAVAWVLYSISRMDGEPHSNSV